MERDIAPCRCLLADILGLGDCQCMFEIGGTVQVRLDELARRQKLDGEDVIPSCND